MLKATTVAGSKFHRQEVANDNSKGYVHRGDKNSEDALSSPLTKTQNRLKNTVVCSTDGCTTPTSYSTVFKYGEDEFPTVSLCTKKPSCVSKAEQNLPSIIKEYGGIENLDDQAKKRAIFEAIVA